MYYICDLIFIYHLSIKYVKQMFEKAIKFNEITRFGMQWNLSEKNV